MPSYTQVVLTEETLYLQNKSYSAQDDRRHLGDILTAGVVGANDCLVTWTSGLTLSVAAGVAYITGGNVTDQGKYRVRLSAAKSIAVGAGHATLPRLDQVILRVLDASADTSGIYETRVEVIPGTPTSGATLANRSGAANLNSLLENSKSVLLLADVLVPAAAGAINNTNIGDKRSVATIGLTTNAIGVADSGTTNVVQPLTLFHDTSATAGVGFGAGIAFDAENAGGTRKRAGTISAIWDVATAGSEQSKLAFQLVLAGNVVGIADLDANGNFNISGNFKRAGVALAASHLSDGVTGTGAIVLATALNTYAPLASPALTGTPTAPTASAGTNTTQIATTAYVKSQNYAPLASPAFTGTVTSAAITASGIVTAAGLVSTDGAPIVAQFGTGSAYIRVGGATALPSINVNKGIIFDNSATGAPNTPTGGVYLWADAGALKAKGTSGTQTTIAPADPHCPECGRDFVLEFTNDDYGHLILCMWCLTDAELPGVVLKES